jgi:hypothetical protein
VFAVIAVAADNGGYDLGVFAEQLGELHAGADTPSRTSGFQSAFSSPPIPA